MEKRRTAFFTGVHYFRFCAIRIGGFSHLGAVSGSRSLCAASYALHARQSYSQIVSTFGSGPIFTLLRRVCMERRLRSHALFICRIERRCSKPSQALRHAGGGHQARRQDPASRQRRFEAGRGSSGPHADTAFARKWRPEVACHYGAKPFAKSHQRIIELESITHVLQLRRLAGTQQPAINHFLEIWTSPHPDVLLSNSTGRAVCFSDWIR